MDSPYASGALGAGLTAFVGLLIRLNHKRFKSTCCGRQIDMSVDVEDTTPKKKDVTPADVPVVIQVEEKESV